METQQPIQQAIKKTFTVGHISLKNGGLQDKDTEVWYTVVGNALQYLKPELRGQTVEVKIQGNKIGFLRPVNGNGGGGMPQLDNYNTNTTKRKDNEVQKMINWFAGCNLVARCYNIAANMTEKPLEKVDLLTVKSLLQGIIQLNEEVVQPRVSSLGGEKESI